MFIHISLSILRVELKMSYSSIAHFVVTEIRHGNPKRTKKSTDIGFSYPEPNWLRRELIWLASSRCSPVDNEIAGINSATRRKTFPTLQCEKCSLRKMNVLMPEKVSSVIFLVLLNRWQQCDKRKYINQFQWQSFHPGRLPRNARIHHSTVRRKTDVENSSRRENVYKCFIFSSSFALLMVRRPTIFFFFFSLRHFSFSAPIRGYGSRLLLGNKKKRTRISFAFRNHQNMFVRLRAPDTRSFAWISHIDMHRSHWVSEYAKRSLMDFVNIKTMRSSRLVSFRGVSDLRDDNHNCYSFRVVQLEMVIRTVPWPWGGG